MPFGVEHAHVIDAIAHDPATGALTLIMVETRPWDGSDLQLFQLQEKFNAYLSFALDGEMAEAYPDFAESPLRVRLDCIEPPDARALHLLTLIREQIAFRGIDLEVHVTGRGGIFAARS